MPEEKKKKERQLYLLLGPLVGVLVLLFSLTKAYERAELVTYDWRFNIRNSLFGPPPMDPRLGIIEVDDQSVEVEGRYQDWTRSEYADVIHLLGEYGAGMVGFDVYFIEPKTKMITEEQIAQLRSFDRESIMELIAGVDYDQHFAEAIDENGNVYLAQYLGVRGEEGHAPVTEVKELSADEQIALETLRARAPRLMVPPESSTIPRALYFEPPLKVLRQAARGFAYAQTVTDVDGARRRYPVVYQYGDILMPSIALMMVCDDLQIDITSVEVWPDKHILLPGARLGTEKVDIKIPIDEHGNMHVNWAGRWEDTFARYPHIALRRAAWRQERQDLLEHIKGQVAENPDLGRNPGALLGALSGAGHDPEKAKPVLITWLQAAGIEQVVRRDPELTPEAFWQSKGVSDPSPAQIDLFAQIRRNNRIAALLEENPAMDAAALQVALPEYQASDVELSANYVRAHLEEGRVPSRFRPLYFYPYIAAQGRSITPEQMQGTILLYGLTATGTTDLSVTPFQGNYPMVGIYANVLNTILQQRFIHHAPEWFNIGLILALTVLLALVVPRLKVLRGAALTGGFVVLYAVAALFSFTHFGLWIEVVGPMMSLVVGYLVLTIYGYVIKEKEKEFVQGAFGHYLSPAVVEHIMTNPDMINQLGGEERVMTAFFSDIASFSTISECLRPAELVKFINEYLSEMCDIIEYYGGTIDKFEGDAIVAFFGAPIYYEDHAVRAVMACIDQQKKLVELREHWNREGGLPPRLQELRQRWESQGRRFAHVRMGVTAGPMVVGNMGSRTRNDYTMMGDTVNLAARFESGQKIYGTGIMINDLIYEQVKDLVETRRLDLIQVMGKEEPVTAYEVLARKGELSAEKQRVLELYIQGLEVYSAFQFAEARTYFEQALEVDPDDGPSALYADRCEEWALNPPKDLVFRAESK